MQKQKSKRKRFVRAQKECKGEELELECRRFASTTLNLRTGAEFGAQAEHICMQAGTF